MQGSKQGMWKGFHLSIEAGIRKGHIFCEEWYIKGKGLDLGVEPPCIKKICCWVYIMYQHQNVSLWQTLGTSMGHAGVWQLTVVLTEVGNLTQNKLHYFSRLYTMMKIIGCICISHWGLFLPKEMARCTNQWPRIWCKLKNWVTLYAVLVHQRW